MQRQSRRHGMFSWNELITTDLTAAKEFYGALFGWTFTETSTIYGNPYLVALNDGKVAALGGEVLLPPTDIPNAGRFCVIKDPQGVSLNLITYSE